MSIQLQLRRDSAANWASVTPAQGECVVDTTNNRILIGDGATAGGWPAAKLAEAALVTAASNGLALGANGSKITLQTAEQLVSGLSGSSVVAGAQIPAGSIVLGCASRVVTTIVGPTSFEVGYSGNPSAFGASLGLTAGSTNVGQIGPAGFYSATNLIVTAAGGAFTAGAVRLALFYLSFTAPTS